MLKSGHTNEKRKGNKIYQIFTDVDDTLHPSGPGIIGMVAGIDREGERGVLYECVDKLHQQIYKRFRLPTIIVSANPIPDFSGKKALFFSKELKVPVEIISGDFGASILSTASNAMPETPSSKEETRHSLHYYPMAEVKERDITAYITIQREKYGSGYRAIWIGDNGQGDLLAAKELLRKGIIDVSLIHYVDPKKVSGKGSLWHRNEAQLFPFNNYSEAIEILRNFDRENLNFLEDCNLVTEHTPHQLARANSFNNVDVSEETLSDNYYLSGGKRIKKSKKKKIY